MSWFRENSSNLIIRMGIKVIAMGPVPKHIAVIMDGNRRYAKKHNLDTIQGHIQGFEELADTMAWCGLLGIFELTIYAFSIENFKRSSGEVGALMELAIQKFTRLLDEKDKFKERGIKVRVIGKLSLMPVEVRKLMVEVMRVTKNNTRSTLNIAVSYTGREEITQAVSAIVAGVSSGAVALEDVSEELISNCLYTSPSSHPDLLIRTSGEVRLSDFLLWQTAYSCIYFTETLWPEFKFWDMLLAILHYQRSYKQLGGLQDDHNSAHFSSRVSTFIASVNKREYFLSCDNH